MKNYDVVLVPAIVGIVEGAKRLGMPKNLSPVLAIALGVTSGIVYMYPEDVAQGVLVGVVLGLSAVGLYSGTKNTAESFKE